MKDLYEIESPLTSVVSFHKVLEQYDVMAKSDNELKRSRATYILNAVADHPELRDGLVNLEQVLKHEELIGLLMEDAFPELLTHNEIKAIALPFGNFTFNHSKRFQTILDKAGKDYELQIVDLADQKNYILAATVVLNYHYGFKLDYRRPLFYEIPDASGVMRYYRILYNADFMDIIPTGREKELTQDDVDELLANFDDLKLWKEKIPPDSFISKGFVISNMFDVTAEHSISEIKSSLIGNDKRGSENFMTHLHETFKSFFNIQDLSAGFVTYNPKDDRFERVYGPGIKSYILQEREMEACDEALCQGSYAKLLKENTYFAISDVDKYFEISNGQAPYKGLKEQGIKSAIFAPIANQGKLLGVLELVSSRANDLNSINALKLDDVMPYIVAAVLRSKIEEENLIDAIIQNECTSVHASVHWRFEEEAKRFIKEDLAGNKPTFQEIVFKEVKPLYGQIDIKNSSDARNNAIQTDLMIQLAEINIVLGRAFDSSKLPIYEELMFRVNNHSDDIKEVLHTNSEQAIFNFVMNEINPVFKHLKKTDVELQKAILQYESKIDMGTDSYYDHRKNYDESVMRINQELVGILDNRQVTAQDMFPHYFERYKTDGIEHNLYIGDSIAGNDSYNPIYLNNLRLWQLQVMCEMENAHYKLKKVLPLPLDVASLIFVYNTSMSIRFRMDEKRFDVDGTYNARYEVIKKRIDKSFIKGTNERLTQSGKMVIVYSQKSDELEYLRYIKFLKSKGYFTDNIEIVELQGLQGVSGLKAIRAEILYHPNAKSEKTYTYQDLLEEIEN